MKKTQFLLFTMALISFNVFSQGEFQIHLGPSIPILDFANTESGEEYSGGAAIGFNTGFRYVHSLSDGLGLFAGIDIHVNGLNDEYKEDIENGVSLNGIIDADVKHSRYVNIPLSAGLNYEHSLNGGISVFVYGGVTLNFFKCTNFVVTYPNNELSVSYDIDNSAGFKLGGGLFLNDNVSIGINYMALGKHNADGELEIPGYATIDADIETKVDILTVTLGYRF